MHNTYLEKYRDFLNSKEGDNSSVTNTILVVDGLNLFFRAFSVVPTLNQNGEHTGAVVGFYNTIRKLIKDFNVDQVVIVFDGKGGSTRRRKLYSEYKEKRISVGTFNRFEAVKGLLNEGESMKRQLTTLLTSIEYLPVHLVVMDNIEADDVIAYCVNEALPSDARKIIASSDKDFLQLVSKDKHVYSLHKKMLITEENFYETVGYLPSNFLTLRCFTGDASDNINGVFKVGQKGLDKTFDLKTTEKEITIDDIINESFAKVSQGDKHKIYHSILEQKYVVYRNFDLMQLRDPPVSGILTSHIRNILDSPRPKYEKLKFHEVMKTNGVEYHVDDMSMWERLAKK